MRVGEELEKNGRVGWPGWTVYLADLHGPRSYGVLRYATDISATDSKELSTMKIYLHT
jgi:hypothetical protein